MAETTYEIPDKLLVLLRDVCEVSTVAWDDRKFQCVTNEGAVEASERGWDAAEGYRWLQAIQVGREFLPIAFGEVHCEKCGDRTDTGDPHDCEVEL